ncbi:protein kinase domain protein [Ichthyophthirius multifiliis]|uniref:Protein kinase domain protein n=1 Tax=Ichthyophthirius multifiliis TaxID=5932 RepID=G0R079_ICHMU|nr:protein kinase domain protein [Ichthyophthirius multifiliis]EGR29139.1 protein kinase domain protein [Ichthyophthirius multifiliis]|eukprot:XP_004030375.1 protein kinase domain protein [Ichthyophthirius multifiliis]
MQQQTQKVFTQRHHQQIPQSLNGPQVLKHVDNYIIFNEKLGGGQFSQVYKAMDKNDSTHQKYFAVKTIPMTPAQYQKISNYNQLLQKEIDILLKARHQNLIQMHDLKQTPNNLYLFLDYCNGGDLRQYITKKKNRLSEEEAVEFFKQMCAGYQALNEKKIIHRDLKPENILLHGNKIKIGDFGFARIVTDLDQAVRMTQKCSPLYAPPQILLNEKYSSKCDVWSMGCIFFEMLYGKPPFNANSIISLSENIKKIVGNSQYQLPTYPPIAPEAKDILIKMLMYNEKDRVSWEKIFKHPILNKNIQKLVPLDVELDHANNPLYQSIRKNIDAVWEQQQLTKKIINNIIIIINSLENKN